MDKSELRKKYILIRNSITQKQLKSDIIFEKVKETDIFKNAKVIALYASKNEEVDTKRIAEYAMDLNKIVAFPKTYENGIMEFYKVNSLSDLEFNDKLKLFEPCEKSESLVNKIDIELMIIPGVCFDTFNNRIGFGKGYYDRYLHDCESIYKLGICFNEQIICEEIQVDEFDIKMNQIISD